MKKGACFCSDRTPYLFLGLWQCVEHKNAIEGNSDREPTGQKPNAFGEIEVFTLKNSQLKVQYSTKWWTRVKGSDPEALFPDIAIETGFEPYKNGEDLVLKTALTHN